MALIVEVVDPRGGGVKARVRLDGVPVHVGRGYDNDLILDDLYVDARHARITVSPDGVAEIEDLGSINGLVVVNGPGRVPRVDARPGTQVRVGRTILRFRDPAEPVPPALADLPRDTRAARAIASPAARAALCVSATALVALYSWSALYDQNSGTMAAAGVVMFVLMGAMWAGGWAVASRVNVNRFNFIAHFTVVAFLTVLTLAFTSIQAWAEFMLPDNPVWVPFGVLGWIGLFTVSVAMHLRLATTMDRVRRWRAAAATIAGLALMIGWVAYTAGDTFTDVPEFSGVVKPLPPALLPTMEASEFSAVVAELVDEADRLSE
ncbi:MAG TPA: FHA domain-containing protein [Longimicrobiales bacterium]|nr:FHA domain-containing protein [Longimicrobiales bacterium]